MVDTNTSLLELARKFAENYRDGEGTTWNLTETVKFAVSFHLSQTEWIPVSGRLPEKDKHFKMYSENVLMYDAAHNYWNGFYEYAKKRWWLWAGLEGEDEPLDDIYKVTHWMPLPASPKETTK